MKKGIFILMLAMAAAQVGAQTVTMGTLLRDMIDLAAVTRFPSPAYTLKQASSYDRRSVSPDQPGWFANGDANQFIREEQTGGRIEEVMMDADGPGCIVRFWLTTQVKPGTMRFYFDGADTPSLVVPGFDLMRAGFGLGPALLNPHSSYEPNGKGGNTLYLPLPYQKRCKVTFEFADSASRQTAHYYQINYRTYPSRTHVETFRPDLLTVYRAAIDKVEYTLWHPEPTAGSQLSAKKTLAPGDSLSLTLPEGPNAVSALTASYNEDLRITMTFDGEQTVDCPLGDFIGSGPGGKPISSWYRALTPNGEVTSRWVMPYQRSARVALINTGTSSVGCMLAATISRHRWDDNSLYFHVT